MDTPKVMDIQDGLHSTLGAFRMGVDPYPFQRAISLYDLNERLIRMEARQEEQMQALVDIYRELMYNRSWYSRLWQWTRTMIVNVAHWLREDPHEHD